MKNIQYINAGAGSGKTTKLTQILSEELTKKDEPVKPSEVILTTFTELAASEFREKSRERLFDNGHPEIAAELDSATIGTVHSVALGFIQKYWYLIGVSPDMKVMSEDDLQVYISESMGNYVSQDDLKFFRRYGSFFELKDSQSHIDLDFWKDHLLTIIDKINNYNVDIDESINESKAIVNSIFNQAVKLDQDSLDKFKKALADDFPSHSDNAKKTTEPIHEGLQKNEFAYALLSKLYDFLTNDDQQKIKTRLKGEIGEDVYDNLVDNLKAVICSSYGNDCPRQIINEMIERLFKISRAWKDGFISFKKDRHIIDYNDMERLFLQLLEMPDVTSEIKGTYKLMMVDEFQDSSPIQLEIFKLLSDLINQSYWVGDPKQSIYGFRGADVELVKEATELFNSEETDTSLNLTYGRLDDSWRSRKPLVNLVNKCFITAFHGIIHKDDVKLNPKRQEYQELTSSLSHWNCYAARRSSEIFTNKVAARIKQLIDSDTNIQIKNKNEFRKIQPGNIAILCRKNDECKQFAKALISKGVPVSFVNDDILQQTEVHLVFTLLKFMVDASNKHVRADLLRLLEDVPTQDILQQRLDYLISLVTETTNEEGKAEIVVKPDLWLEEGNQVISKLMAFKQSIQNMSVSDMLESIIYGMALPEQVAKWGDVDNRRQNLQTLCALAKKYDEHCQQMGIGASIGGLLTYLSYAVIDNKIDNAANAVKVLTYHKSKGLEWPYVILSSLEDDSLEVKTFCRKNFWGIHELRQHGADGKESYIIQLLPRIVSTFNTNLPQPVIEACCTSPSFNRLVEKEKNDLRNLLYVGMTRARDYLTTLSMQGNQKELPILSWIRNTGISDGDIAANASELWGKENLTPQYEDISDINIEEVTKATEYSHYVYPENPDTCLEPKFISPSKLPKIAIAQENVKILEDLKCRIEPYNPKTIEEAAAGTCIHNIFAVYDPSLSHQENVDKATNIRNGNNMYEIIPDTDKVISSIENLYAWLTETYGKPYAIKHEVPFIHPLPGQIVNGEIDLLWYTNEKECVLIDFKNFPGTKATITTPGEKNKHYAGKYASQLLSYRNVLQASGLKVRDTLIYYSVMGCVVRITI